MGTITWALDPLDIVLSPSQVNDLGDLYQAELIEFGWIDNRGRRILCWDGGRMMNHSCHANSLSPIAGLELAVRDIAPGEQITCDYAALNIEEPFTCACGSANCRDFVAPAQLWQMADIWDAALQNAVQHFDDVAQPLRAFLPTDVATTLQTARRNPSQLTSTRTHWFDNSGEAMSSPVQ